ncbi:MAG: sensor histidine kinase [Oscillospiraceae bacterium]
MVIASLALVFLNIYSASNTRELMFQAKYASMQDKIQVIASSFETADTLSAETVDQVISVLGDINVSRLLITDGEAKVLYDSSVRQNAVGQYALLEAVVQALGGSDVFHCAYHAGALQSFAAVPIMSRATPIGCVYVMDFDAEQGEIIENLERNILRGSWILLGGIVACSAIFSVVSSKRMRKILMSMRLVREGEYSHKIQMRGDDEYTTLATEFNKLTDRLQESEATQRQFVSDASHELKTPLASIKLLSDSILQNDMDADTMREFVSDIGNESDRLTRMTQKLLTLSKADAQTTCEHEVVDLGETVRRVFRMLVPLADRTQIQLTASLDRGCYVLSMEDDAYQIIFNLVENGIKYNHAGGSVHVTVRHTQDEAELLVEDTGMGIPQDAIEHIFERFYRVDKARSRQAGGSGLGLSIVHELVERNFGTIEVSSKEGEGTKFTVRMPYFELEEDDDDA